MTPRAGARRSLGRLRRAVRAQPATAPGAAASGEAPGTTAATGPGGTSGTTASAAASAPTVGDGENSEHADLVELERVYGRPAAPVRALVAASPRLLLGLAPEWDQQVLCPSGSAAPSGDALPDVVLVEVSGAGIPGWPDAASLRDTLSRLNPAPPLIVWVTATPASADLDALAGLLDDASAVLALEPQLAADLGERLGRTVEVLAPAAQPRVQRPSTGGPGERRARGTLLMLDPGAPSPEGAAELADLIGPAVAPMPRADVDVVRRAESAVPSADQLPRRLRERMVGGLPAAVAAGAIGRYRVLLDAGRETPGSSWSLVEAAASQTAVVTTAPSAANLPDGLAELVPFAAEPKALRSEVVARLRQPELRDREALRLHRTVLDRHTFAHRVGTMLDAVGVHREPVDRSVSAVVPTNREHELDNVFANIGRQRHRDVELVLVLHGIRPDAADLRARARAAGVESLELVEADSARTLGACMNLGVDAASGAYVAKMDDDNFYGAHFTGDLLRAFDYTDAGIVGKWAHYVWLRSSDAVVLRYVDAEHRPERRVQGGSMIFDGDLVRSLKFSDIPRAVDSDILDRAAADGVGIYSGDRFNYVSIRGVDRHAHTWQVADATFMTGSGRLVFYGDPRPHVDV